VASILTTCLEKEWSYDGLLTIYFTPPFSQGYVHSEQKLHYYPCEKGGLLYIVIRQLSYDFALQNVAKVNTTSGWLEISQLSGIVIHFPAEKQSAQRVV
jgi:hypothetical protein